MHLNLPFANDREFARLHAAIRLVLPIVPALAASSPLQDGRLARALDQRMVVYRTNAAEFPAITGRVVPEPVHDRAEYESRILAPMYEALRERDPEGVLRHEWLNSRGAIARFDRSSIEIRVPDVQECPVADLAIAAAVTSVVRAVWEREARLPQTRNVIATETLAALLDACVREADEAPVEDASYLSLLGYPGRPCSAGELWAHLLSDVPPDAPINEPMFRDALDLILEQGTLARRIVRAVGRTPEHPRVRRVYAELCDCLDAGRMFGAAR
jgi:gamma-glutamyl:cysteine ligase YbdK (ATP-grasp superfamily)